MPEWWTYGVSDFLMYAPATWWRMVERHNLAAWPLHLAALAAGGALAWGAWRGGTGPARAGAMLLALAWAWVGWAFHWQRHAEVSIAAPGFAWSAWTQAALLAVAAVGPTGENPGRLARSAGLGLLALALLAFPLASPLAGRSWREAEVFALLPDPTALATLGWLLATPAWRPWQRGLLATVPVLTLAAGAAMRWAMAQ